MTRPATLARITLLAAALAAPAAALADRPTEEVAFYYNKIAFQYATTKDASSVDERPATPMLTPIDALPGTGHPAGRDVVMKGSNILLNAVPAEKPKEIVVVGSKPPVPSGLEHTPSFRPGAAADASRRAHPDFAWTPRPLSTGSAPATPPAAIAAPAPKPQPYTLIELLPLKGRR